MVGGEKRERRKGKRMRLRMRGRRKAGKRYVFRLIYPKNIIDRL